MKPTFFLFLFLTLTLFGWPVLAKDVHAQKSIGGSSFDSLTNDENPLMVRPDDKSVGKVGQTIAKPDSKIPSDLLSLYEEYYEYRERINEREVEKKTFRSKNKFLPIVDDAVKIDAVASNNTGDLVDDLRSIGAENIVAYGRIVSCRIPISAIAKLNELTSLHFVRPAYAGTKRNLFIQKLK